MNRGKRHK